MSKDSGPRRILMGVSLIVLVLFGYVLAQNYEGEPVYYITVSEALQREEAAEEITRVAGFLNPESISWMAAEEQLEFEIFDPGRENSLPVIYSGDKPENIEQQEEVVVEGYIQNGLFQAERILFQCPSEYREELDEQ